MYFHDLKVSNKTISVLIVVYRPITPNFQKSIFWEKIILLHQKFFVAPKYIRLTWKVLLNVLSGVLDLYPHL